MAVQIPYNLVPEISVQNSQGSVATVSRGNIATVMRLEESRDSGDEYPVGPCAHGLVNPAEVFGFCGRWVSQREMRHQNIRQAFGTQEAILGEALLGERILC